MYDWGDGRENMLERYREKIDFCMRFKINMPFLKASNGRLITIRSIVKICGY